jgi:hypothetical protein
VEFEGGLPALNIRDMFISDNALAQQVSADAVVPLGFVLGGGFTNLHIRHIGFTLEPFETKRQLRIAQVWADHRTVQPGETVEITALFEGEDGLRMTRSATYHLPIGAPLGNLNITVSDANALNFPDFAGLSQSELHDPVQMIQAINQFRDNDSAYVRIWRQEPAFTVGGPSSRGELTDPPPSIMLVLADPSGSTTVNPAVTATRGSSIAEIALPLSGYVVSGAKTIQVEVKE